MKKPSLKQMNQLYYEEEFSLKESETGMGVYYSAFIPGARVIQKLDAINLFASDLEAAENGNIPYFTVPGIPEAFVDSPANRRRVSAAMTAAMAIA